LLDVPLVYFVGTRPNWYRPIYPTFVEQDFPADLRVLLTFGKMRGPYDEREPVHIPDRSNGATSSARSSSAFIRHSSAAQSSPRIATAARSAASASSDSSMRRTSSATRTRPVSRWSANGLSLCSIHHRAFDHDLVGVAPNLKVHVSRRLLEDDDGPMLDVLKGFHGTTIEAPTKQLWRPDPERLAVRFERFGSEA
jgi:putative restriction endonuclease